ncbi:MAG TPA: glutamate formimidoyltransferase [Gaiellaceae bacterium]|nr:glutamate formimidoyltransferase [Gaiellaceae bacterium]
MLEAVPNVSEGRDTRVIAAIGDAFERRAALLDVHSDPDHHRSVFTLVAGEDEIVDALLRGIAVALELVDLRAHSGAHPRVGVADVVPIVPLAPDRMPEAAATALVLSRRTGAELGLPVFRYGEIGDGRRPAFFRRGGLEELMRRVGSAELVPDDGPARIDPRSGVVLVGARPPLIAYNLELDTDDVAVARAVAESVRESSGGMRGLQAIGLERTGSGRVQVSMNVIDIDNAPLHEVVERVRREAARRGVEVRGGELVGLVPDRVVRASAAAGVALPGVDESRVLENVLRSRLEE